VEHGAREEMADDDLSRLTDAEKVALVGLLKRTIDEDRYPLSRRIRTLWSILAKLEPPKPTPAPLPPLKVYAPPRATLARLAVISRVPPSTVLGINSPTATGPSIPHSRTADPRF
jgi:hypothetical protein